MGGAQGFARQAGQRPCGESAARATPQPEQSRCEPPGVCRRCTSLRMTNSMIAKKITPIMMLPEGVSARLNSVGFADCRPNGLEKSPADRMPPPWIGCARGLLVVAAWLLR